MTKDDIYCLHIPFLTIQVNCSLYIKKGNINFPKELTKADISRVHIPILVILVNHNLYKFKGQNDYTKKKRYCKESSTRKKPSSDVDFFIALGLIRLRHSGLSH